MKKIRAEFADTMVEVGTADPRLVVLVGDISHGILQPYAKACPGRYYNVGICEPTIVNMAAGLSKVGLIPVVHTIAPFIIERAYEQIKLDFGYQKLALNLVSVGGAFDYSQLGCSHHCYTDVSLIAHLHRGVVMCPGSCVEFNALFKQTYDNGAINYLRVPENPHGHDFKAADIVFGKGMRVAAGDDVTIVCFGTQLGRALEAAMRLGTRGVGADVLYVHTLKPLDAALVRESASRTGRVLVVEELSAHDGLFNMVLRACLGVPNVRFAQIAIHDFVHGYGSYDDLCERTGFTPENIEREALGLMKAAAA